MDSSRNSSPTRSESSENDPARSFEYDVTNLIPEQEAKFLKDLTKKTRREEIEKLIDTKVLEKSVFAGKVKKKKAESLDSFDHYRYSNGKTEFPYVRCKNCHCFVSAKRGGHQTRHITRRCVERFSELPETCEQELANHIVTYCLKSGTSFNHLQSDEFQELVKGIAKTFCPTLNIDRLKMPSRVSIREHVELKASEIISNIGDEVRPYVRNGSASLVIDFGVHVHSFLSVFIVYVSGVEKEPVLEIRPFAFCTTVEAKTAENVRDLIIGSAEKFGITPEEICGLSVISDGATNLKKMGKLYFKRWCKCGCHSVQKMSERLIKPTIAAYASYTSEDFQELDKCQDLLEDCAQLSVAVHRQKDNLEGIPLPSMYVVTRWQSQVRCAKDIQEVLIRLMNCKLPSIREMAKEIHKKNERLSMIIAVLEQFEPLLLLFESSNVNIHVFLPKIYRLNLQFVQAEEEYKSNETLRVLNKSGKIVTRIFLDNDISELHYMSTLMCPAFKKMTCLDAQMKEQAEDFVKRELNSMEDEKFDNVMAEENNEFADLCDPITDYDSSDELCSYIAEVVTKEVYNQSPLKYWSSKQTQFPKLSRLALTVFSVLSSETVCERAFSAVKRVVTDERHKLDEDIIEKMMISYFYENQYR